MTSPQAHNGAHARQASGEGAARCAAFPRHGLHPHGRKTLQRFLFPLRGAAHMSPDQAPPRGAGWLLGPPPALAAFAEVSLA